MKIDSSLPLPEEDAQAHSACVVAHLREAIAQHGGFIPFSRYMELVLYAPGLGYYASGTRKFGADGDFVTGPELTPLYGAALARQVEAIFAVANGRTIIELGAGSGALAASLLDALAARDAMPERYCVLEVSPDLRARQQATIATRAPMHATRVEWLDRLPDAVDGAVVMNEVLDAIPPQFIVRQGGRWLERGVTWDGALRFAERPLDDARLATLAAARFPPDGDYASEVNPAAEALVTTIARRIASGALVVVDYGFPRHEYYHPQRREGTLVGHYRHRVHHDPFLWPGLSDLTAHVDFTAIAEAGERGGAEVAGFATQASSLVGCGILELLAAVGTPDSADYLRAAAAVQKLVSPAEMGELFKVMLLSKGTRCESLAATDMTHRL
ncbi:MAG TPA: SAM-dependent methyltransferase [Casimicrobiaceae bacterium]|nr:SAM-dependent methyltransferase [Casimicrobiaceae bacterium]